MAISLMRFVLSAGNLDLDVIDVECWCKRAKLYNQHGHTLHLAR